MFHESSLNLQLSSITAAVVRRVFRLIYGHGAAGRFPNVEKLKILYYPASLVVDICNLPTVFA